MIFKFEFIVKSLLQTPYCFGHIGSALQVSVQKNLKVNVNAKWV